MIIKKQCSIRCTNIVIGPLSLISPTTLLAAEQRHWCSLLRGIQSGNGGEASSSYNPDVVPQWHYTIKHSSVMVERPG